MYLIEPTGSNGADSEEELRRRTDDPYTANTQLYDGGNEGYSPGSTGGAVSDFEDSGYPSANTDNFSNEEYQGQKKRSDTKRSAIKRALADGRKIVSPKNPNGEDMETARSRASDVATRLLGRKLGEGKYGKDQNFNQPSKIRKVAENFLDKKQSGSAKTAGGTGAKGVGAIDPEKIKGIAEKAMRGDAKGAVKEAVKAGGGIALDKLWDLCLDSLVPTFGITYLGMVLIVIISMIGKMPITKWKKWVTIIVTILLILIIAAIIALLIIIFLAIFYTACEKLGLKEGGVMAALATPAGFIVDVIRGDQLGSTFASACKMFW